MYQPFCAEDKEKNRFSTVWKHFAALFVGLTRSPQNRGAIDLAFAQRLTGLGSALGCFPWCGKRASRARIAEGKFCFGARAKRGPKPNREKVFHGVENRNYHL